MSSEIRRRMTNPYAGLSGCCPKTKKYKNLMSLDRLLGWIWVIFIINCIIIIAR